MTDVDDARIRSLVVELVESSPPAPPLPAPPSPTPSASRRVVLALVALVAVVTPAVVFYADRDEDVSPAARIEASAGVAKTRTALVVDEGSTASVHDLDAGTRSPLLLPHRTDGPLVAAAGHLVYVGEGSAWALALNGGSPVRRLGNAAAVTASHDPRRVWLVEPASSGTGDRARVREVAVDGTSAEPYVSLPREWSRVVVASGSDHLMVVSDRSTRMRAWSPGAEYLADEDFDARRLVALHTNRAALAVDCDTEGVCRALRVRHPVYSGADSTTMTRPPGTAGWLAPTDEAPPGAFSGDGTLVAIRAAAVSDDGRGDVFVTSPFGGPTTKVPDSEAPRSSRLAWSADGRWLFFEQAGSLAAYRPADERVQTFSILCCRAAYLTVDRSWLLPSVRPAGDGSISLPVTLPREGIAMERDGGVTLSDLAGRDLVRLDGLAIAADTSDPRLLLTDGARHYVVLPGSTRLDVVVPADAPPAPSVDGCEVADLGGDVRYLLCPDPRTPSGGEETTIEVLEADGRRRRLAGAALRDGGRWRSLQASPDGSTLLAQYSGECENPTAFLVPVTQGGLVRIDPGRTGGTESSFGLGWTRSGDAVVQLISGGCSSSVLPGVYIVSARGDARLLLAAPATPDGTWPPVGLLGD